jgi:Zn-dependent protease
MRFSKTEIRELAIAWAVLGLCFSVDSLFNGVGRFLLAVGVSLIGVGTGFIVHEISHKLVAQRFGYWAEFRLWRIGLIIAFASALLTMGRFLFAAPGAVHILGYTRTREQGIISLSGPLSNLVIAGIFYLISMVDYGDGWFSALVIMVCIYGFQINLWLASFNLIPIQPLDGRAIMSWSMKVWILMVLFSWGTLALWFTGYI